VDSLRLHGGTVSLAQFLRVKRGGSRPGNGSGADDPLITSSGAVGPIASLTHVGVALRRAVQEVDPRFDRLAAPASANCEARQASWGWKPELPTPNRKREQLGGRRGKKNGEVNSSTPGNRCVGRPVLKTEAGRPFFWPQSWGRQSWRICSRSMLGAIRQMWPWPRSTRIPAPGMRAAISRACATEGTR
jgi:hypothetical protein